MNLEKKTEDSKSDLEASKIGVVPNLFMYNKYLNWVSGEFELYLQDDSNGLKVYFPSGHLSVRLIQSNRQDIYFEIYVKSKNRAFGTRIHNQVIEVLNQIYKLQSV
ncbi:hypothetical protein Q4566_03680 [Tamlana sp. 2_MG-2023]|uniref:hypothetical protein n=1 Tax=unclassified Tamlana TaxID=2614803 RepID=UPI0026E40015|nr:MULTISPECIES: hypothetical protein [unclassified Tamlana]MDO6759288.1 hypothetical protein [Tamlana sp. 2_MG-2023]MDO6790573.1 hypothetical protein [Tamlana sp. 1_MG-2023]